MRPAHRLYVVSGVITDGANAVEEFSWSLRGTPIGGSVGDLEDDAQAVGDAYNLNLNFAVSSQVLVREVLAAEVDATGAWETDGQGAYRVHRRPMNTTGGRAGGAPLPRQSAVAISLTTARAGASGKGRFFLPLPTATLGADGRLSLDEQEDLCTGAAAMITAINDGTDRQIVVASSKGFLSPVTGVRVGRVVDTMRSRRRDQAENYSACPVTTAPFQ